MMCGCGGHGYIQYTYFVLTTPDQDQRDIFKQQLGNPSKKKCGKFHIWSKGGPLEKKNLVEKNMV